VKTGDKQQALQVRGSGSFLTGPENGKTARADVILMVVSVLNLSYREHWLKKGEAWLNLG
jgi:hypothetical protein